MKKSLDKSRIKILLLEGISQKAVDYFKALGYENVELLPTALQGEELKEKIDQLFHIMFLLVF